VTLDLIHQRAALTPERPAVHWQGHWLTYRELEARTRQLAGRLAALGVTKGERVSILAFNHLAHLELIAATAKLGFIYAPLNYRLAPAEQRELVRYLRSKVLLFDTAHAEVAEGLDVPHKVSLTDYEAWLADAPPPPAPLELTPADVQMILPTGGTTGLPKGAMLPYRQVIANAAQTVFSWGLREDERVIQATPCFHAAVNVFTTPLLYLGGSVVLTAQFEPSEYLRLVEALDCTIMFMVPTMFKLLAEHPDFAEANLSGVRWAISGGAPCPAPVREAFAAKGVRFKQGYGLTEAGVNCFAIDLTAAEARPESVGKPVLGTQAVVRREDGTPAATGEVGELTLRGLHLFAGYFEKPEATAEVLREGWLWTGDLARCDEEGFFTIVGRRKELFISGGENVYPVEIENALYEHPEVAECAVVGVPDERWGEVGLAAVVPVQGSSPTPEALKAFLRERLARYKVPKHVVCLAELPKSGAGKVLKRELVRLSPTEMDLPMDMGSSPKTRGEIKR
jgi:fatty-acyl-CoA synthase